MTLYGKFEDMSRETNQILTQAGQTIRELKLNEVDDRCSISSFRSKRSADSGKSQRSKLCHRSLASTTSSTRQRRLDLEEEIATLRVKMQLAHEKEQLQMTNRFALDEMERRKLEIQNEEKRLIEEIKTSKERFQLREELAEKEARVEVCARLENEDMPLFSDNQDRSDTVNIPNKNVFENTQEHIQRFLDSREEPLPPSNLETVQEPPPNAPPSRPQLQPDATVYVPDSNPVPTPPPNAPPSRPQLQPDATVYVPDSNPVPTSPQPNSTPPTANIPSEQATQLLAISKLLEVQNQNRLPIPEPVVFNGDPLHYPTWVKAFETLIEGRAVNAAEKLHFLGKYVSGEAKEVVNGFMPMDGDDAYQKSKEMLAKRFGDPFIVATAFRKRLDEWKPIAPHDAIGLRKYADFLVQCEKAMEKVTSLNVLNDDQENHKMMSKLPKWVSNRWVRTVYKSKIEQKRYPLFAEFVKFLVTESNIACNPVNLRTNKGHEDGKRPRDSRKQEFAASRHKPRLEANSRNFATKSKEQGGQDGNPRANEKPVSDVCQLCKGTHDLNTCQEFCKMNVKDRKKFASEKGLCFGCLGQGHISRQCRKRKTCTTCRKSHPTSLHGDLKEDVNQDRNPTQEQDPAARTVNCTKTRPTNDNDHVRMSSMIVSVWIHHKDNPESEKLVYALLDDQSDTTFITQDTLRTLKYRRSPKPLVVVNDARR